MRKVSVNMATVIRPEVSMRNKYYIDKHRHYELKHFCLQYPIWKRTYADLDSVNAATSKINDIPSANIAGDPTGNQAVKKVYYLEKIEMVERAAKDTDAALYTYILKAVTEGLSYTHMRTKWHIPCGRDMFYDRYRKFFWLLSNSRK